MSIGDMVFPSIESSSMDDQVISQVPCINTYINAPLVAYKSNQIINSEADRYLIDNVENDQGEAEVEDDDDAYFSSLPSGYRFKPLDEELIEDYLRKKIDSKPLPRNQIREVELYKYNPEDLAVKNKANGEDEWYFFTPRDRKYPNGNRPNRAAGKGYWKATGADKAIKFKGKKVGLKKSLVFYRGKAPNGIKTDWIMHEYKVVDLPKRKTTGKSDMKLDDWVLCKIRKKRSKSERSAKAEPSFQEQPTGGELFEQVDDSTEFAWNAFNNNYEMEVPFIHDFSFANAQQTMPMMGHNSFAAGNYGQISEPSTDSDPDMDQIYLP